MEENSLSRAQDVAGGHRALSIEARLRIRGELHALQIGLDLLRAEMLSGDFHGADLTYATLRHCLTKLSNEKELSIDGHTLDAAGENPELAIEKFTSAEHLY